MPNMLKQHKPHSSYDVRLIFILINAKKQLYLFGIFQVNQAQFIHQFANGKTLNNNGKQGY